MKSLQKIHPLSFNSLSQAIRTCAMTWVITFGCTSSLAQESSVKKAPAPREIIFHTEVVDGSTRWLPASTEVKAGEKLVLIFQHKLASGPEFHGVSIPDFKIQSRANRNKEARFTLEIPKDSSFNEIPIKCQFHPAHVEAKLVLSQPK